MSRLDREAEARMNGMDYALRRIKEIGIEEFEKELEWRGRKNFSAHITSREAINAAEQAYKHIRIAALITLYDEFDFDKKMLDRFNERYNDKMDSLNKGYVNWGDYENIIVNEIGYSEGITVANKENL